MLPLTSSVTRFTSTSFGMGNSPDNWLLASRTSRSFAARLSSIGISPEITLLLRSSESNSDIPPSSTGICPTKLLPSRSSEVTRLLVHVTPNQPHGSVEPPAVIAVQPPELSTQLEPPVPMKSATSASHSSAESAVFVLVAWPSEHAACAPARDESPGVNTEATNTTTMQMLATHQPGRRPFSCAMRAVKP